MLRAPPYSQTGQWALPGTRYSHTSTRVPEGSPLCTCTCVRGKRQTWNLVRLSRRVILSFSTQLNAKNKEPKAQNTGSARTSACVLNKVLKAAANLWRYTLFQSGVCCLLGSSSMSGWRLCFILGCWGAPTSTPCTCKQHLSTITGPPHDGGGSR